MSPIQLALHLMPFMALGSGISVKPKVQTLDFDDNDFYLNRRALPHTNNLEDLRRGQEGVLIKLKEVTQSLEEDELKLNNIFYKLGQHENEMKSVKSKMSQLSSSSSRLESKLNKHSFNVEFLHRQLQEMKNKVEKENAPLPKVLELETTVTHLEERLSQALFRLNQIEGSPVKRTTELDNNIQFSTIPKTLVNQARPCPKSWEHMSNNCYRRNVKGESFADALASCNKMGGHLLGLQDSDNIWKLHNILIPGKRYWTSGTDALSPGDWRFLLEGSPITKSLWGENGRPHSHNEKDEAKLRRHHGLHCAVFSSRGLEATKCSHKLPYICQKNESH